MRKWINITLEGAFSEFNASNMGPGTNYDVAKDELDQAYSVFYLTEIQGHTCHVKVRALTSGSIQITIYLPFRPTRQAERAQLALLLCEANWHGGDDMYFSFSLSFDRRPVVALRATTYGAGQVTAALLKEHLYDAITRTNLWIEAINQVVNHRATAVAAATNLAAALDSDDKPSWLEENWFDHAKFTRLHTGEPKQPNLRIVS